jgi:hypothetical protein
MAAQCFKGKIEVEFHAVFFLCIGKRNLMNINVGGECYNGECQCRVAGMLLKITEQEKTPKM